MACLNNFATIILKQIKRNPCKAIQTQYAINSTFIRKINNFPQEYSQSKDPAPYFFNEEVQNLLKQLSRVDLNRVFKHKRLGDRKLEPPTYKFMTDEELQQAMKEAAERANDVLQMPPVVKLRSEINQILSKDPALKGYDTAKYVFTDITFGISNRDRLIAVREPDGTLSKADWDTRHRMNQIYFPQPGRELKPPRMFEGEYFTNLLERKEYEFILDRACSQFEPDDPEYQRVTSLTYDHVNETSSFEMLRSTRHFGPLAFYLVWFKQTDNLLLELIETAQIDDANQLIKLFAKLHDAELVIQELQSEDDLRLIEKFIADNSQKKGQLELALQSYKEALKQKLELEQGIKRAHGLT